MKKTYSSLTQLKVDIEKEGKETVLEFNGAFLLTQIGKKKFRYGLYKGEVSRTLIL